MMKSRIFKLKIQAMIDKYEDKVLKYYIENGPSELRKKLDISTDDLWNIVYDYLLFEKEAVKKCVRANSEYIQVLFEEKGPFALRCAFQLNDSRYDEPFEYVMDYIGISRGGIYRFVSNECSRFRELIAAGKASRIRRELCLSGNKYLNVWEQVLDILLDAVSTTNYSYSTFEQGLRLFTNFYNSGRRHRSLNTKITQDVRLSQEQE